MIEMFNLRHVIDYPIEYVGKIGRFVREHPIEALGYTGAAASYGIGIKYMGEAANGVEYIPQAIFSMTYGSMIFTFTVWGHVMGDVADEFGRLNGRISRMRIEGDARWQRYKEEADVIERRRRTGKISYVEFNDELDAAKRRRDEERDNFLKLDESLNH